MFAIAFDLVVADTAQHDPKGVSQAYADIGGTLANFGFDRVQGSLYTTPSEDLANLFGAIMALKALPWLPASVRDIRAFRVEQWSDFTKLVKS
jgi:virulence-associated protein VapD